MSAQELLQQLSAVGLGGADDTSADSVASSQVNASASSQVNASEDDQAANERSRARAGVQRRVRRRLCWHMRKLKKERTAMRQLQAQALHHRRHGANRTHDQWVPTWKMVADALTKMMDTSVLRAAVGAGVALFQAVPKQSGTVRCGSGTKSVLLAAIGASRLGGVLGSDALAAANTVVQIPWQDCTSSLLFAAFLGFEAGAVLSCCLRLVALVWLWRQPSTPQQRDGGSREEYSRRESEPVRFSGRSVTSRDVGVQSPVSYARNRQQPRLFQAQAMLCPLGRHALRFLEHAGLAELDVRACRLLLFHRFLFCLL